MGESQGAFAPVFSTILGRSSNVTPPSNFLLGDRGVDVNDWFSSTGVRQRLPWGAGTWSVSWDTSRTTTNNPISSFDPSLQSGLQVAFSQPLLKDRKIDAARQQYIIAKRNQESSELRFRESVVQTVAAVKQAYWTLKATMANVTVQQRSLELAQELARQNKIRVDAGQIPPLDLVQAEAEVAQRRENLIRANTTAEDAEDRLRRLIMDPADASFWRMRIDPIEEPPGRGPLPDVDAAVANALNERYDLARAGHELENARTNVEFLSNQKLPDVRLETSYRGSGLGGTQFLRTGGFPGRGDRHAQQELRRRARPGIHPRLSDVELWRHRELSARTQLRRGEPGAGGGRAPAGGAADREPPASGRRDRSGRRPGRCAARPSGSTPRAPARRWPSSASTPSSAATRSDCRPRSSSRRRSATCCRREVNLLQTTLDYESSLVNFEAVQQAPPLTAGDTVGLQGGNVVLLPTPAPRGVFRPGGGGEFHD